MCERCFGAGVAADAEGCEAYCGCGAGKERGLAGAKRVHDGPESFSWYAYDRWAADPEARGEYERWCYEQELAAHQES